MDVRVLLTPEKIEVFFTPYPSSSDKMSGCLARGQRFSRGVTRRGGQRVRAGMRSCGLLRRRLLLRVAQLVRLRELLLLAWCARRRLTSLRSGSLEGCRVGGQLRRARY